MIQQIDTLNRIANAFSDFASLNKQSLESISIMEAVKDVIHVFKNNNVLTLTIQCHLLNHNLLVLLSTILPKPFSDRLLLT